MSLFNDMMDEESKLHQEIAALKAERDELRNEYERLYTSNEKQCSVHYFELVDMLEVPPMGSVIEAVERIQSDLTRHKEMLREQCNRSQDLKSKLDRAVEIINLRLDLPALTRTHSEVKWFAFVNEANKALKQIAGVTKLGTGHYMVENPFDNANVKCEAGE